MKLLIGASLLALAIADATVTGAQSAQNKAQWNLRLNETRGPIRTADVSPLPQGASSEILGGSANGSENAYLLYTRMAPGARGPALFTLPVEHYYVVLSGKMTVQIGTDTFTADPMTGVVIPLTCRIWCGTRTRSLRARAPIESESGDDPTHASAVLM